MSGAYDWLRHAIRFGIFPPKATGNGSQGPAGPAGPTGPAGLDGWSPLVSVAQDGARRVLAVVGWTGGQGSPQPATGYVGASGLVSDVSQAVDVRGAAGAQGPAGADGAAGAAGTDGAPGAPGANGSNGSNGLDGWSPVFAVVTDGARRVLQLQNWIGGGGSPSPGGVGQYVSATGMTSVLANAVDIRGAVGADGLQGPQGNAGPPGPNLTTAAMGYTTGAGGTVAQQTSKTTGVTLNKLAGVITMNGAALAAGAEAKFTVTNNQVAAVDVPMVAIASVGTSGSYAAVVTAVANGSFDITVTNLSAASLSQALVLNFVIFKGANA